MPLTYNPKTETFIFRPQSKTEDELAQAAGLTLSRPASHRERRKVYYTKDEYAALPFWEQADAAAQERLFLRRMEWEASCATEYRGEPVPAPPGMVYMPFQLAGIRYALDRAHALIGDEPGLGKTVQAIGVANAIGARRVLVICPASVRLNWRREIRNWSTIPRVSVYPILKSSDGVSPTAHYLVVSYDLARTEAIHRSLMALNYDLLVIDEAHYLKTPDARRTQAIFGGGHGAFARDFLAKRARKIVALTGTPLPNRPRECYTLVRALCWDAVDWISYERFLHRYNPSFTWPSGRVEERQGRLPELQARLRCNLMVRRLKAEVLHDLPEKRYELVYVEETGQVKKALQAERLLDIDPLHLENADADILGQISTVRRQMGEAKAPLAVEHIKMLLDGGLDKVVVFAWHRSVLDLLQQGLRDLGTVRVDGQSTAVQKHRAVEQFISDPGCRVFMANMQAAGVGIDGLQKVCQYAVFAESSWTPADNEQAVDRLHRHGQRSSVMAQFLVAPGSLDERIIGTAIRKQRVTHQALDEGVSGK